MTRPIRRRAPALLAAALFVVSSATAAQDAKGPVDEAALAERITEQVIRELREGGVLAEQIQAGIEEYVRRQREAREQAEAEQAREAAQLAKNVRKVSSDRDHVFGNPSAEISLIEYSDYECPYCKRFHAVARRAVDEYAGKVNWVYRHYPLAFHNPLAQKMSEASECAAEIGGNDAFWRYSDTLFERTTSNGDGFPLDGFVPLAVELGLDGADFERCVSSGRMAARVLEDLREGEQIGIRGTPGTVLVDRRSGKVRVVPGAVPLEQLKSEIDALIAER